jgi:ABC-2 type transport system permease protein
MTLLNVERIKLFSTRSPYWCLVLIPVIGIGITLLISLSDSGRSASLESSQAWVGLALSIVMVMAALAITTEYRFGTIRNTFLAEPRRTRVLLAKAVLLFVLSVVVIELTTAASFLLARAVHGSEATPGAFDVTTQGDMRVLWGPGVIAGFAAVLAIAVGALVRQSAGAIALLLLWPLLLESLFPLFGSFGRDVAPWLPFNAGGRFYSGDEPLGRASDFVGGSHPNWWQGGLEFAGVALVFFVVAAVLVRRRDA